MINRVRLGDYVKIRLGKLDANTSSVNGRYPLFTCSISPLKIDSYAYDCECVLVAGNGNLNVKYYNGKFNAYQRTYIIESNDKSTLNVMYLYFYIDSYVKTLRRQTIGGVIKYIKLENLTEIFIPLPPLEEQTRIVKMLDKVSRLVEKKKEQISLMGKLCKDLFIQMFGDPVTNPKGWHKGTVKDIIEQASYGKSEKACEQGKYKYLRMSNITYDGNMDYTSLKFINLKNEEVAKYTVIKGDLLFNRTNSKKSVGKTAVYKLNEIMAFAGYLIRVRTNKKANTVFLSALLNSSYGKKTLYRMCKSIGGQANINSKELQSIPVFVPPVSLQKQFAEKIERIEQNKQNFQIALTELQDLRDNLFYRAFNN